MADRVRWCVSTGDETTDVTTHTELNLIELVFVELKKDSVFNGPVRLFFIALDFEKEPGFFVVSLVSDPANRGGLGLLIRGYRFANAKLVSDISRH